MKQVLQVKKDDAEATSETVESHNQWVDWMDGWGERYAAQLLKEAQAKLLAESGAAAVDSMSDMTLTLTRHR